MFRSSLLVFLVACSSSSSPSRVDAPPPLGDAPNVVDARSPDADLLIRKRVFITSTEFDPNFGGASAADSLCGVLAAQLGGTWTAYLSQPALNSQTLTNAIDRITGSGPWYLVDRTTLIFASKAAVAGQPMHSIDLDELGVVPANLVVWTGSSAGGLLTGMACQAWSSTTSGQTGRAGVVDQAGQDWLDAADYPCNLQAHLYCFEN